MTITENRHARAHVDGILIALVIAMSLFGIVAVCVATYSPQSSSDASFLNHIVESSYLMFFERFLKIILFFQKLSPNFEVVFYYICDYLN